MVLHRPFEPARVTGQVGRVTPLARHASFADTFDPYDPEGAGYSNQHPSGTRVLNVRTEKKAIARKRFRPPGDGRFFDGHH